MEKILIKAYSQINLGDDLFVKVLCDRYPEIKFTIVAPKSKSMPYNSIPNLEVVHFPQIFDSVFSRLGSNFNLYSYLSNKLAKEHDLTIHIGGSIFIQSNNWVRMSSNYRDLIQSSNKFMILGSNFGPYYDEEYYETYKRIFKTLDDITVREQKTYDLFSDLENIRLAPDIVFGMNTEDINSEKSNKKRAVISMIDTSWRDNLKDYQEDYEKSISDLCGKLLSDNYEVILMSYCAHEGDEAAIKRILTEHDNNSIKPYYYDGDMEEALKIIKSSDCMVSTRFHAFILAMIFDKPVFPYVYSPKITNVINDIDFTGKYTKLSEISKITTNEILEQLYAKPKYNIDDEIKSSQRHFDELDKIIK